MGYDRTDRSWTLENLPFMSAFFKKKTACRTLVEREFEQYFVDRCKNVVEGGGNSGNTGDRSGSKAGSKTGSKETSKTNSKTENTNITSGDKADKYDTSSSTFISGLSPEDAEMPCIQNLDPSKPPVMLFAAYPHATMPWGAVMQLGGLV
jgi:hypothetical protein